MEEIMVTTKKTPIEIALQIDDEGFTTAKKLYEWLELNPAHYASWVRKNITENPYADEKEFSHLTVKTSEYGGRPTQDYRISATLAKKISMTAKSDKGNAARDYFIGCEQALVMLTEQRHRTELERAKGIAVRQALTKALQQSNENERMHGHAYSTYTDVVYKAMFGKSAKKLREEYGITKKENLRDCFSEEELKKIQNAEMYVSSLIGFGYGYEEIKQSLFERTRKYLQDLQ